MALLFEQYLPGGQVTLTTRDVSCLIPTAVAKKKNTWHRFVDVQELPCYAIFWGNLLLGGLLVEESRSSQLSGRC
jgi:hypothetical protein